MSRQPRILYLHGFNSSPGSYKATALLASMQEYGTGDRITIPDIPGQPLLAIPLLEQLAKDIGADSRLCLVGSSLGGYYATWLAETFDCKAVLVNPAVRAQDLLRQYIGVNVNYHTGEIWIFTRDDVEALAGLYRESITRPGRYRVLLQTGDETLDYRQAAEYYRDCNLEIEQGGDHAFTGFEDHIEDILAFFGFDTV